MGKICKMRKGEIRVVVNDSDIEHGHIHNLYNNTNNSHRNI